MSVTFPLRTDWANGDDVDGPIMDLISNAINYAAAPKVSSFYRPLGPMPANITSTFSTGQFTTGMATLVGWASNANKWRYVDGQPIAFPGNSSICINNNNGHGADGYNQQITVEFWTDAPTIAVVSYFFSKPDVWGTIDDCMIVDSGTFQHVNLADGLNSWKIVQTIGGMHKYRLSFMGTFYGIAVTTGYKTYDTTPGLRVGLYGDSYIQAGVNTNNAVTSGTAGVIGASGIPGEYMQQSGLDIIPAGITGTGYIAQGALSTAGPYGATARIAALAAMNPLDLLLPFGSVNDAAETPSVVAAAAISCWAAMKVAQPSATIIAVGPECYGTQSAGSIAVNDALKVAALGASGVDGYVDLLANSFITGTGHDGGAANNGNADIMISGDSAHPTHIGMRWWAYNLMRIFGQLPILNRTDSIVNG